MTADITVKIDEKALAAAIKKLDQFQGAPLALRTQKAIQAGMKLFVPSIRAGAARHRVTGETERTASVRKLPFRPGEIAAYKVGIKTWYGHFVIAGIYGHPGDPYVNTAVNAYSGEVTNFINTQITRLA